MLICDHIFIFTVPPAPPSPIHIQYTVRVQGQYKIIKNHLGHLSLYLEHCYSVHGTLLLYPWNTATLSLEHCYYIPGTLLLYPWNTATPSLEKEKEQTPGNFNVRIERHRVPNVLLLIDGS